MSMPIGAKSSPQNRELLIGKAFKLELLTVLWMLVEAASAVWSGNAFHSTSVMAFGIDSFIELISATVLIWRLSVELKRGKEFPEEIERRASKISGWLLLALAVYIVAASIWSLWYREAQVFSPFGLALTLIAMPVMYFLAKAKIRIADQLNSRAMRADAVESITCGYLALAVAIGLVADYFIKAWWVDGITSLAIVIFILKECSEALRGERCCDASA